MMVWQRAEPEVKLGAKDRPFQDAAKEDRSGSIMQDDLTQADGHAERKAALDMVHRNSPLSTRQLTLGADKDDISDPKPGLPGARCRQGNGV